jgi:hypothetical protein
MIASNEDLLTVVIPVWNAEETLGETLESLVGQTRKDFYVCVVDDCSTDATQAVAQSFANRLKIELIVLPHNVGPGAAANHAIRSIQSRYIARIDADDIAQPNRLEQQLIYLETNSKVDVCSTWMHAFYDDHSHEDYILQKPLDDASIKTALVQYCAISNGASMFRRSFFQDAGLYNESLRDCEDYDLWCRGALLGKTYASLAEPLTKYRQRTTQPDQAQRQAQYQRDLTVKRKYISALLNGAECGHVPEFLHMLTLFSTREVAVNVLQQSMPTLSKLANRVSNEPLFWEIVAGCIGRHLNSHSPI